MKSTQITLRWVPALLTLAALLAGCVNQAVERARVVPLVAAEQELPREQLLNVNIAVFDPNIPADPEVQEEELIFPSVRQAESAYLAYNLRQTMEGTGNWGAVRVVPDQIPNSELLVTATIIHSDGETLELGVRAADATGRVWIDKVYRHQAGRQDYRGSTEGREPFQALYNELSNDLLAMRNQLRDADLIEIQRVSALRFAADIAPDAFGHLLAEERGRYRALGLPAVDDPMFARVERIRERDHLLIDSLDAHYLAFHESMAQPYAHWRAVSYQEAANFKEMQGQARGRKVLGALLVAAGVVGMAKSDNSVEALGSQAAVLGGGYLFKTGIDRRREAEMHIIALREVGDSLGGDLEPRVIELEGRTVTLNGSAQVQYREWRELLREIYAEETGLPVGADGSRSNPGT